MKVAEKTQEELALALKAQRLHALDSSMLFDRALETVVTALNKSNLNKTKDHTSQILK